MRKANDHFSSFKEFSCKPEDLLGREPIVLEQRNMFGEIKDSSILITGAAGSIGSELALQICHYWPRKIVLIDQAETGLHSLEMEILEKFPAIDLQIYVANITDAGRMSQIFAVSHIQTVFHAAAYKHVPVMENHPYEAIKNNILGTQILADLAVVHQVRKFLFISTDKAVNPASIMGATKRFAEMYLQYLAIHEYSAPRFIITRFGNVLGSNGSFLQTFERQIRAGGPVTVTHPNVQRYFMTVSEACQLVLEAAATSNGNEIAFFDMGKPILIRKMARRMIRLSGFQPNKDIRIEYIGLRPGEKLREELYRNSCRQIEGDSKIKLIPFNKSSRICMKEMTAHLLEALHSGIAQKMIEALKSVVPEYQPAKFGQHKRDHRRLPRT